MELYKKRILKIISIDEKKELHAYSHSNVSMHVLS